MEWKELGVVLFGLLNFAWTAYVFSRQQQKEDKQLHLSQSSEWYADIIEEQKEMKIAEKELRSSVQHYALQVAELTYKIQGESKEKEYFKSKIERLVKASRQSEADKEAIKQLADRRGLEVEKLKESLQQIKENQIEQERREFEIFQECEELKDQLKRIRESNREAVKFYENALKERDEKIATLSSRIKTLENA